MKYGKSFDSYPLSFNEGSDVQVWFVLYEKGSLLPPRGETKIHNDGIGWMISKDSVVMDLVADEFAGEESVDSYGNLELEFYHETSLEKVLMFLRENRIELEEVT